MYEADQGKNLFRKDHDHERSKSMSNGIMVFSFVCGVLSRKSSSHKAPVEIKIYLTSNINLRTPESIFLQFYTIC